MLERLRPAFDALLEETGARVVRNTAETDQALAEIRDDLVAMGVPWEHRRAVAIGIAWSLDMQEGLMLGLLQMHRLVRYLELLK